MTKNLKKAQKKVDKQDGKAAEKQRIVSGNLLTHCR